MEKYKRFQKEIRNENEIQPFLDELTTEGWSIIYYDEKNIGEVITITVVCKKNQNMVL